MTTFKTLDDNDPLILTSPLIRGVLKVAQYIADNDGIGLTPSKAFNRKFVHWAAAELNWPNYSEEDLFSVNKVLNEWDFPPVVDIHELMLALKLGRHYKGKFLLTKFGRELVSQPARLLAVFIPNFLFRMEHGGHLHVDDQLAGNWDIFLNVINVEADHGAQCSEIRKALYGAPQTDAGRYDPISSALYISVLRPLCWAGLLEEQGPHRLMADHMFTKTELWSRVLRLETDTHLRPRLIH